MLKKIPAFLLALTLFASLGLSAQAVAPAFTDVPEGHPHKDSIDYCTEFGFMHGKGGGKFDPNGTFSRAEFITLWARTFQARKHNFHDATKTKDETDNAIVLMQGLGYVDGVSPTEFAHAPKMTRQEVAMLVKNTYLRGITPDDEYMNYSDHAQIAAWARNAISICYKKGIFADVAIGSFKPKQLITRAEASSVIMKLMKEETVPVTYDITVAALTDGAVVPDKTKAAAGETVSLTVTPDAGFQLKAGTLKYNGEDITGATFTMPSADVTITAEFEPIVSPTTHSITVAALTDGAIVPDKTTAAAGETITLTITPDTGFQLKAGTLKYNGEDITGTTFTMPDEAVTITAEFEAV